MGEQAEVRVKLVFDKAASDSAKAMAGDVGKIGDAAKGAKGATKELTNESATWLQKADKAADKLAGQVGKLAPAANVAKIAMVGAGAAGAAAFGLFSTAVAMATSAAFDRAERLKATAMSLTSLAGKKNVSVNVAMDAAKAYDSDFRKTGIAAGVMAQDVKAAFETVAAQTNAQGAAWGQLGGKARLTLEQSQKIAENMAHASKLVPGGLNQITQEYENLKQGIFSSQGAIVQLMTTTGVLKGNAVEVAKQLAMKGVEGRMKLAEEAMARAAKKAKELPVGWEGFKNSLAGMKEGVLSSMGEPILDRLTPVLTRVQGYFTAHADEIMLAADKYGGKIVSFIQGAYEVAQSFLTAFDGEQDGVGKAITEAFEYAEKAFKWIYDNKDAIAKTFKDVFGVVLEAIKKAYELVRKTVQGNDEDKDPTRDDAVDYAKGINSKAATIGASQKEIELSIKRFEKIGAAAGMSRKEFEDYEAGIWRIYNATKGTTDAVNQAAKGVDHQAFAKLYNQAALAHNDGQVQYMAKVLAGNKELQKALIDGGDDIVGGLRGLMMKVASAGDPDALAKYNAAAKAALGTKPVAPQINFNGATFNIKQDFRDQDPDRVAIVFRSDIMRAAQYRTSSALSQPFGT